MKTFKEYIKKKLPVKFLDSPHSFAELRELTKKIKFLDSPHSFAELRDKKVSEDNSSPNDYDAIHDHINVRPRKLLVNHKKAIFNYTAVASKCTKTGASSSSNINEYLRNRAGIPGKHKVLYQNPKDVEKAVKTLSSAFTPENTNKITVIAHGAVPSVIGEQIEKSKKGDIHHFAGFTSTSATKVDSNSFWLAKGFSSKYRVNNPGESHKSRHIIRYQILPGSGLSAAANSDYPHENEMILHHGAKIEYSHTDTNKDNTGVTTKIHHVIVHPDHRPLESYDEYKE